MRAAIYARVSSAKQRDAESIKSQLTTLRAFVARQGWTLVGEYEDDGRSAKTGELDKRDSFARLVRDAEAGRFDVLVVLDINRLTRTDSIEERAQILGPFQRCGIDIYTPSSGRQDLRSFLGQLYVQIQALVAAEDNRKRAEAIMAGKLRAIAEGKKPAGPTPYGYVYSRETGKWAEHPAQAPIVREIFERVARGEPCRSIGDDLSDRGLERPRGGGWTLERVWQIVHKRTYLGEWVADKERDLRVPVPQIVDDATWHAAHRTLKAQGKRGLRRTKYVYLLESIAQCELCDSRIRISSYGAGPAETASTRAATYVCALRRRPPRGTVPCTLRHHKVAEVDRELWDGMSAILARRDLLERAVAIRESQARADTKAWRGDLEDAQKRLERLQRSEAAILARFRRGVISEAALDIEIAAAARERAILEHTVAAARRAAAGAEGETRAVRAMADEIDAIRRRARRASPEVKREIVRILTKGRPVIVGQEEVRAMVRLRVGLGERAGLSQLYEATCDYVEFPLVIRRAA